MLNISNNQLGFYDKGFNSKWKLQKEFFWGLPNLETLDLSSNSLITIPRDILLDHPGLRVLLLSNNRIKPLKLVITIRNTLEMLDLSSNGLSYLHPNFLREIDQKGSPHLTIDLSIKPFHCACELKPMAIWIRQASVNIVNKYNYTCSSDKLQGKEEQNIAALAPHSLCPVSSMITSSVSVTVTILFCGIVCALLVKYKLNLRVAYHLLKWKFARKDDYENDYVYMYVVYNDYSDDDRKYVTKTLRNLVEREWGFKLFILDRDSHPGSTIAEEIVYGLRNCRKIIIIHSVNLFHCRKQERRKKHQDLGSRAGSSEEEISLINAQQTDSNTVNPQAAPPANMYGEWIDFSLLTVLMLLKHIHVCVIRRGNIEANMVSHKWYPLLFPNEFLSPVKVINVVHSVCIDFSYRWLACVPLFLAIS